MKVFAIFACASVIFESVLIDFILKLTCCFVNVCIIFLHYNLPFKVTVYINMMRFKIRLLLYSERYVKLSVWLFLQLK